ncbi:hypothetical protein KR093_004600 [Drosophila rubida]|uniref:Pentatricopeptide repeat-containing protein 1, mitochondrial n=1 Tax=Drosophila rubida TaxID=30044 RepID=A0AAD4JXJ6_9MUSC|nr:hypothetical protein KR093_004600 [Drosophila rubida]
MTLRFVGLALISNTRRITQCKHAFHYERFNRAFISPNFISTQRELHVRISDQDAGLDSKRAANRDTNTLHDQIQEESKKATHNSVRHKANSKMMVSQTNTMESNETEISFGDADSFGDSKLASGTVDASDRREEEFLNKPTRQSKKLRTKEYARLIKENLSNNRINEAIYVLEVRMLRDDRVKPENYIYNLLISGCAKAGYTRKAFSLFTKMRQRGLKVTGGTYTSLFNACANAPSHVDGLAKAQQLRDTMVEKGYEPNVMNYNAMIKAYGRCGDVQTAFMLADEMIERQLPVTASSFNFLLQACASDAQLGFRYALLTWHKMQKLRVAPDCYTFNAMLRCVRDCGFGELESMHQVLEAIGASGEARSLERGSKNCNSLVVANNAAQVSELRMTPSTEQVALELPNLLLPGGRLGNMVALTEVTNPHERFLLLGGLTGYLDLMLFYKITPDIKSFSSMLEVIPPTNAAEKQLLSFVRKIGLKADIDFFNILIKKRSMRFDYESAREVLTMIRTTGLKPDIVTYGVLALGCRTKDEARELLQQMQAIDIRINIAILGAMLRQGCARKSFDYVNEILQLTLEEGIKPNEPFLRHLHNFHRGCARAIDARHPSTKTIVFKKGHSRFCDKYRIFYEEHGLSGLKLEDAVNKLNEKPYAQYKEASVAGIEPSKHDKVKRKTKVRRYIKKIKIAELKDDPSDAIAPKRLE